MLRNVLRRFSNHKVLRSLNREMRFNECKQLYQELVIHDETEQKLCKEQYLYSLKFLELLDEESVKAQSEPVLYLDRKVSDKTVHSLRFLGLLRSFIMLAGGYYILFRGQKPQDVLSSVLQSKDHIHYVKSTGVRFTDVRGINDCREEIEDIVDYLKNPHKYSDSGARMTKGVLLTGRPGTGKTLLAKAIAGEAGCKFYFCSGSEFDEMFVGLGAKRIRSLFESAKKNAPCIIFIDEIDAIASSRSKSMDSTASQSLNQLLIEMDGFTSSEQVVVIGATNLPESLDKALRRSGRFDKEVNIPLPDLRGRTEIIDLYLSKTTHDAEITPGNIATKTTGMTGAELANVVNIAALNAVKEGRTSCTMEDFENSIDRIKIGLAIRSYSMSEEEKMNTIYHELGHAVVGYFTQGAGEIHKVTILPRGMSLGHTSIIDPKESQQSTREEMLAHIDVCMGGRAAEEIFFGKENISAGCSSDLNNATRAAYYALRTGIFMEGASYQDIRELGEDQRNVVDREVSNILDRSYERAKELIQDKVGLIEKLAMVLKEKETINKEEFINIANQNK